MKQFRGGGGYFFSGLFAVKCLYEEENIGELAIGSARFKVRICGCEECTPPMPFS